MSIARDNQHRDVRCYVKEGETPEQAEERRQRESRQVEARIIGITSVAELENELARNGDKLVLIEVTKDGVCETGLDEEPEIQWKADRAAAMKPCADIKHVFARVARESKHVEFYAVESEDTRESQELIEYLGVDCFPSLLFYKNGRCLWTARGYGSYEQNIGEGMLWYGAKDDDTTSPFVKDLYSRKDYIEFLAAQPPNVLTVVDVSVSMCEPCMHIFPAVRALAKNFVGFAAFARLVGDSNDETEALMKELKILEVPTFIFYRDSKEMGRHVGSSRGDLIGQILQQQASAGIQPPAPPKKVPVARTIKRRV